MLPICTDGHACVLVRWKQGHGVARLYVYIVRHACAYKSHVTQTKIPFAHRTTPDALLFPCRVYSRDTRSRGNVTRTHGEGVTGTYTHTHCPHRLLAHVPFSSMLISDGHHTTAVYKIAISHPIHTHTHTHTTGSGEIWRILRYISSNCEFRREGG